MERNATPPEYLTLAEVAATARVGARTVARWVASGYVPTVRFGARVLVSRAALEELVKASSTPATSGPLAGRRL